jgi:hypothetical protein
MENSICCLDIYQKVKVEKLKNALLLSLKMSLLGKLNSVKTALIIFISSLMKKDRIFKQKLLNFQ